MKERIKKIRKESGLTQEKFAERLGLKRNTIATYETGKSEPMDSIIVSICREFNVNEEWLRTGKGEMIAEFLPENEYFKAATQLSTDKDFCDFVISYWKTDKTSRQAIWNFLETLISQKKK